MRNRSFRDARFVRIVSALGAVAIVVAANQASVRGRSSSVLGLKVERCNAETSSGSIPVDPGSRIVRADALIVPVSKGKLGAALAPSTRITPGTPEVALPVAASLGVRPAGTRRLGVTMTLRNLSDCPMAVSIGRVSVARGASPVTIVSVRFGGSDRVIVRSGERIKGHAEIPLDGDGSWQVGGSVYADLGAAA